MQILKITRLPMFLWSAFPKLFLELQFPQVICGDEECCGLDCVCVWQRGCQPQGAGVVEITNEANAGMN